MIISLCAQKGGVGKTTLSINMADCLSRKGARVLLIDADKQASASAWAAVRTTQNFSVIGIARDTVHKEIKAFSADYDHIIVDGPPHAESISRSCIAAADYVLVPVEPSGLSVWAADLTIKQIDAAKDYFPALRAGMVVSRKIRGTAIGRDIRASVSGIDLLSTEVQQRVVYAETASMGQTVFDAGLSSPAAREIEKLVSEIMS
ncbi:ParA family partition ATPase [Novosphingobium sp. TCA1]|uniref:ParA family partition ATPase n=1 Tax=Novosphingobium sp. TCA1 TaxID=2682474 RepID=UPI00130BC36E|nr:ParA family partition ATPase [Novosphingobium sp. TCA1]GFE77723.1 cobyrinic acid a,c-diamide synthase [Novosphingobium sp. TCA1]